MSSRLVRAALALVVVSGAAAAQGPAVKVASGWGVKLGRSALDSSALVDLTMNATPPAAGWTGNVVPNLDLRCVEHALWVMIQTGPPNPHASGSDKAMVAYQIDDQPRVTEQWNQARSGDAVTAPDAKGFIVKLASAKKLHFEGPPVNGATPVFDFPLTGLTQAITPLTNTCPLTTP